MSQENSRFASMLNVNGTTYAYYPVSAVAGSEQLPYSLTVLLENVLRNAETPEAAQGFDRLGYRFSPAHSTAASYVFLREGRAN